MPVSEQESDHQSNGLDRLIDDAVSTMPKESPIADTIISEQNNVKDHGAVSAPSPLGSFETPKQDYETINEPGTPMVRDSEGNIFDPDLHSTGPDGSPTLNRNGTFRKKRGRKAGMNRPANNVQQKRTAALEAGRATAEAMFAVGVAIGGEEWSPIVKPEYGINEPQQITAAWAAYYEQTGKTDVPPWVAVAIACGSYAAARVRMPKTQSRLRRFMDWCKARYFDYQNKRQKKGK